MSDIGDDTSAELHMMRDAYLALRAKDPNHELLKLAELHPDEYGFNFTLEFGKRCIHESDRWNVQGYARYIQALKAAS